ncbi:MAG: hypothetical protein J2P54_11515 [Bradyrhizobiaceae bacterium]|nr:hypothetical protein [Bradyrhizobiaceae bacterium]
MHTPALSIIRTGKALPSATMHRAKRVWQSATACVVAYVFALYSILSSLTPLPVEAVGATAPGVEVCLHADPAAPARHSSAEHCKLCLAYSHLSVPPPTPPPCVVAYASKLRWAVIADDFAFLPASVIARPRGPPLSA